MRSVFCLGENGDGNILLLLEIESHIRMGENGQMRFSRNYSGAEVYKWGNL